MSKQLWIVLSLVGLKATTAEQDIGRTEIWAHGKEQAEQAALLPASQADWYVYVHGGRFLSVVLQLLTNYHEVTNWN